MSGILLALAAIAGLGTIALAARAWHAATYARTHGRLVGVDLDGGMFRLRSDDDRLTGRPDIIRRRPDGRPVPIEVKSRRSPPNGPSAAHRVQIEAYCLLLEAELGIRPPYGLVRYAEGTEWEVPWTADARAEVVELLADLRRPYRGAASPGPGKCAGCRWRPGCDAAV